LLNRKRVVVYVLCRAGDDPFRDLRTAHTLAELVTQVTAR
jgi:hypothetical protein